LRAGLRYKGENRRRPGDSQFRAFKLDVMRIEAGMIAEITTFNADMFAALGLQPAL
jgi:hypothetical protein